MRANITREPVLHAAGTRPGCEDGIVDFVLGGREVVNEGEKLPYFTKALSASNMTVPIDIGTALEDLLGTRLTCDGSGSNSTRSDDEEDDI